MEKDDVVKLRSEEVRVKFHPDMKKRVDRIAALHGTPTATWCHHVIAEAVVAFERQMQVQNKTVDSMVQAFAQLAGPELAKAIEASALIEQAGGGTGGPTGPEADGAEGGVKG